ncbi:hypothetical protein DFH28DRAFT_907067 [Melampsora americana]|nr:hypothetical protein DFH28DRAFT_907067 [Melampsora americana]
MTLPGSLIPNSNKRQRNANEPRRPAPGSVAERLAQLQQRKSEASQAKIARLDDTPVQNTPPGPHHYENNDGSDEEQPQALYDHLQMNADNRNDDIAPVNDGVQIHPPGLRSDYFKSVSFQERTLKEELHWKEVIPDLFNAFMVCSHKTRQWGDEQNWNHDFNSPCQCPQWKRSLVEVDVVDLTCRKKITLETCNCRSDIVRLVMKGYIGGAPVRPRTAFSIRLLAFHHILWKYCTIRLAPFVEAFNEFLDAGNPLFLIPGTEQTRDLRKTFSAAVDAYREMLRLEDGLATKSLRLSPLEKLATNCPPCFGPKVTGKRPDEPDIVICLDGNFQHRRHESTSATWRGETGVIPSLFIRPEQIKKWEDRMGILPNRAGSTSKKDEVIDPCSNQHTAANDIRGRQTWRGFFETGLMGMACRHDHLIKFINIVQTGERGYYPLAMMDWILKETGQDQAGVEKIKLGILYDIGCNLEKSVIKVSM